MSRALTRHVEDLVQRHIRVERKPELVATPVVSVALMAYNHAPYIQQALESVLSQETDFPVELVISDDFSTDETREIIQGYQSRYPERIALVLADENLGCRMPPGAPSPTCNVAILRACRGKYTAMLEGDDYWTDSQKLQRQVDYLNAHPGTAACFTDCRIVDGNGQEITPRPFWNEAYQASYTQSDCLSELKSSYGTATLLFRSSVARPALPEFFHPAGSDFLFDLIITEAGTLDYCAFQSADYRVHQAGDWSGSSAFRKQQSRVQRLLALLSDPVMRSRYGPELRRDIAGMVLNQYLSAKSIGPVLELTRGKGCATILAVGGAGWDWSRRILSKRP